MWKNIYVHAKPLNMGNASFIRKNFTFSPTFVLRASVYAAASLPNVSSFAHVSKTDSKLLIFAVISV